MFMSDWSALMKPPEGHPGQQAYTFVIRISPQFQFPLFSASLSMYLYGPCMHGPCHTWMVYMGSYLLQRIVIYIDRYVEYKDRSLIFPPYLVPLLLYVPKYFSAFVCQLVCHSE
jgi:hypothetical protein